MFRENQMVSGRSLVQTSGWSWLLLWCCFVFMKSIYVVQILILNGIGLVRSKFLNLWTLGSRGASGAIISIWRSSVFHKEGEFSGDNFLGVFGKITGCSDKFALVAFCLGLRFALKALPFVSKDLAFCLQKILCFIFERSCVLSLKILRFAWEALRFCLQRSCVLPQKHCFLSTSKILRFVSKTLRFVFKDCVFLWKNCVLSLKLAATDDSPVIPERTTFETPMNMSPENKAHFQAEKEAIHLILTGIRDEIYLLLMLAKQLRKYGKLSKGYNKREWSRFVAIVKQQHKMNEVSYHKLFDILKQYQKEVNELRAERLARNANPLALVATAQANQDPYYQTSKSHKSYTPSSKPSILTRTHTTTRYKGKEIAKPITPLSETAFEEDNNPEQAQRDKDITSSNLRNKNVDTTPRYKNDNQSGQFGNQRTVNVAGARENVGSPVVQLSGIQCFNYNEFRHFAKECRKPKRVKDSAYHKEKMLLCKQAEQGVLLQAEQYDWLADTDEEIDKQELEAHYSYMAKIQEVPTADSGTDSEPLEQVQSHAGYNVFANELQHSEQSKYDDIKNDQNDVESDDERVALANLIANLKLDVNENKKIQKKLKKANTTPAQELKECKTILAETSNALGSLLVFGIVA
nr:hypothetical protein [Tanacetum cinerariifolium]